MKIIYFVFLLLIQQVTIATIQKERLEKFYIYCYTHILIRNPEYSKDQNKMIKDMASVALRAEKKAKEGYELCLDRSPEDTRKYIEIIIDELNQSVLSSENLNSQQKNKLIELIKNDSERTLNN